MDPSSAWLDTPQNPLTNITRLGDVRTDSRGYTPLTPYIWNEVLEDE